MENSTNPRSSGNRSLLKVLHILDHSLPLHSGYTFRSQNLFKAQRAKGIDPVILTSPKHEQSWKGDWAKVEQINGFTYYRTGAVPSNGLFPILPEIRLIRALRTRLGEVVETERPSVLHAHSPFLNAVPALKISRQKQIPLVYEIRAFWEDAAADLGTYSENSLKYRLVREMETRVCRRASHVTVLCEGLKNDLIKRGIPEDKITAIFNGVDPGEFKPSLPDEELRKQWGLEGKTVIGFIGSFYHYEGLDLLIKAFARLAPNHPELVLLLVGGGKMKRRLEDLARTSDDHSRLGRVSTPSLGSRIVFPGRIPHEHIPGVYALIDILVYPRYSIRLTELVTPLKPLEAMAMGKAIIASDVGGHRELIREQETGLLFRAGDIEALTESIRSLILDEHLRSRLKQQGQVWVREHHTWERTTNAYGDIYTSILS